MGKFEYEDWFDDEFFECKTTEFGTPKVEGDNISGIKGSVRNQDCSNYFTMAVQVHKLFGSTGNAFLDVGCGMGFTVRHLQNLGNKASGFDVSQYGTDKAVTENIYHADIRDDDSIAQFVGDFDVVLCDRVLEYLAPDQITHAFENLKKLSNKYFVTVIIPSDHPVEGIVRHARFGRRTMEPTSWWEDRMKEAGLWEYYNKEDSQIICKNNGWYGFYIFDFTKEV